MKKVVLLNQNKSAVYNYNHITNMYIGADNKSIKADFANGTGCQIATYSSTGEASAILCNFLTEVRTGATVYEFPKKGVLQNIERTR